MKQVFTLDDIQLLNDNELADLIIANNVGCTVKVDDNLDPFAIITCLSSTHGKCVEKVFAFLVEKCTSGSTSITINNPTNTASILNNADYFINLLKSPTTAWLINDRLINMPPQIVPNMLSFLLDDLKVSRYLETGFIFYERSAKLARTEYKSATTQYAL